MTSDLVINVAQLLKADVGASRAYDIEDDLPELDDRIKLTEPVRGKVQLLKTNRGIVARASLHTAARLECSRCLTVYVQDLPISFSEEYVPTINVTTGLPANVPHEGHTYLIDEKHELDLRVATREYGLLELPMQPLCRSDCAGLCPICGQDRNEQPCSCVVEPTDDRFAALRALLTDEESAG